MPVEIDTLFYQTTLVDLYNNPNQFYNSKTIRKCGSMQYIDFAYIGYLKIDSCYINESN